MRGQKEGGGVECLGSGESSQPGATLSRPGRSGARSGPARILRDGVKAFMAATRVAKQITSRRAARVRRSAILVFGGLTLSLTACVPAVDLRAVVPENDPSQGPAYTGPLVITRGGTYRGNWQSFDPAVPAVSVQTREPVVIEGSFLRGRGHLIKGEEINLTVRNTTGYALNPLTGGSFPGRFLAVYKAVNLQIENNTLFGTAGMYINLFVGNPAAGQTIKILRNQIRNVDGRYVNQLGEFTGKRYYVQAVQFNRIVRVPNIEIAWNEVTNEPGKSAVEDNINIYESSGTAASPIRIHNNYIYGAYAPDPLKAQNYSGGGILLGDGNKDNMDTAGGYVEVYNNQVINTSNHGVAIAGGHHHRIFGNRILSSGLLPSGMVDPNANVGVYVWNIKNRSGRVASTFVNNSVQKNIVGWKRFGPAGKEYYNNLWTPSCLEATGNVCKDNQDWPAPVTQEAERQEFVLWQQKLEQADVVVGATSTSGVPARANSAP